MTTENEDDHTDYDDIEAVEELKEHDHANGYEHLLLCDNVQAVYEDDDGTIVALVTEKVAEEDLDYDDIVANSVDEGDQSDVQELPDQEFVAESDASDGDLALSEDDFDTDHFAEEDVITPIPGGSSESHLETGRGTAGYLAEVVDTSKGVWDEDVSEGDIVRVSCYHTMIPSTDVAPGNSIVNPSPMDGGTEDNVVGQTVGYLPIDGKGPDVAARSIGQRDPSENIFHDLPTEYGQAATGYVGEKGDVVTKTGWTTGVTEASIKGTDVSARVNYGDAGKILKAGLVYTEDIGDAGDSTGPTFFSLDREDGKAGKYMGRYFAGSDRAGLVDPYRNDTETFGVEYLAADEGSEEPEKPEKPENPEQPEEPSEPPENPENPPEKPEEPPEKPENPPEKPPEEPDEPEKPDLPNTLTVSGSGDHIDYYAEFEGFATSETSESADRIGRTIPQRGENGEQSRVFVDGSTDSSDDPDVYNFRGNLLHFAVDHGSREDLTVQLNGEEIDLDAQFGEKTNTLRVESDADAETEYEFIVNGSVKPGASEKVEQPDSITKEGTKTTVKGTIGAGDPDDVYVYSGSVERVEQIGPASVSWDN